MTIREVTFGKNLKTCSNIDRMNKNIKLVGLYDWVNVLGNTVVTGQEPLAMDDLAFPMKTFHFIVSMVRIELKGSKEANSKVCPHYSSM